MEFTRMPYFCLKRDATTQHTDTLPIWINYQLLVFYVNLVDIFLLIALHTPCCTTSLCDKAYIRCIAGTAGGK